jgi:hypothetical protein
MITLVFLLFATMFAVAGTFISLEAKRRNDSPTPRPTVMLSNAPGMRQTSPTGESDQDSEARAA